MTQPFEEWKRNKESKHPQFKSWSSKCDMEMLLLHFVRSLRSKSVTLFVESLEEMLPFCFVLDHLNYARSNYELSSVLLKHLKSLSSTNPTIYTSFLEGDFVVTKTFRNFSSIPIDHAHEKKKKLVKEDGGTIGLTENTAALTCWMVCGPEIAIIVNEFEENMPSCRGWNLFASQTNQKFPR